MTNELLHLRNLNVIDAENGIDAGSDGVLMSNEPGYGNFKAGLDGLKIHHIPSEYFENMDTYEGFSPLERRVADQYLRTITGYQDKLISDSRASRLPRIDTELRTAIAFSEVIGTFYLDMQDRFKDRMEVVREFRQSAEKDPSVLHDLRKQVKTIESMVYPFTESYVDGINKAVEIGREVFLKGQTPDRVSVVSLPDELTGYVFGKVSTELLESPDYSVISYSAQDVLPSVQDVIGDSQYGPLGFYELGVGMSDTNSSYASPVNLLSPLYGKMMAAYVFEFYRDLLDKGMISKGEEFVIYEHGGWDGKFAEDILGYIESKKSSSDPDWRTFAESVRYVSVEISSAGVAMQKRLEDKFHNFKVVQGDAITWKPEHKSKGVALSVLMLDSFPPQMIYKINGKNYAGFIAPTIACATENERDMFLKEYFPWYERGPVGHSSSVIQQNILGIKNELFNHLYLDKDGFKGLQERLSELKAKDPEEFKRRHAEVIRRLSFVNVLVPSEKVAGLEIFLKRHDRLGRLIHSQERGIYLNTEIDKYVDNISENYFSIGGMMAVDVGSALAEMVMSRMGGVQIPQFMMQAGAAHYALDSLRGNEFGSTVLYLVPWNDFLFDTLNRSSKGNARNDVHKMLEAAYGKPSQADMAEIAKATVGNTDEESLKKASALFENIMDERGFMGEMSQGHKIIRAVLGEERELDCYNWHKNIEDRLFSVEHSCSLSHGLKDFIDFGGVDRCLNNIGELINTSLSYLSSCQ